MNTTARKMSRVMDELITFFFGIGSDSIQMDLSREPSGYGLTLKSSFDPAEREKVVELKAMLGVEEKDEAMEEFFWQLAGANRMGMDSELQLVGKMVDLRRMDITEDTAELVIYKGSKT